MLRDVTVLTNFVTTTIMSKSTKRGITATKGKLFPTTRPQAKKGQTTSQRSALTRKRRTQEEESSSDEPSSKSRKKRAKSSRVGKAEVVGDDEPGVETEYASEEEKDDLQSPSDSEVRARTFFYGITLTKCGKGRWTRLTS